MNEIAETGSISILNLVSGIGLFFMLGFAWLMSSNRWKVNWRLVVGGLCLQLFLAAVLFQSQNWTFSKQYDSFAELYEARQQGQLSDTAIDQAIAEQLNGSWSWPIALSTRSRTRILRSGLNNGRKISWGSQSN